MALKLQAELSSLRGVVFVKGAGWGGEGEVARLSIQLRMMVNVSE